MRSESLDRLERLFLEARSHSNEKRDAFLAAECGSDYELRREVEELLQADAAAETEDFLGGLDVLHQLLPESSDGGVDLIANMDGQRGHALEIGGEMVGHYQIVKPLGRGGMGTVYKAVDVVLGRTVALKFLADHLGPDSKSRERFLQEARAASALDHPNIAPIFEIGEYDGRLFIAMACCEGVSLKEKIEEGPIPVVEALTYAIQIADGLSAAHRMGIIHRDVKPANVIVDGRGHVRLLDFGVAKVADVDLTKEGMMVGTVSYMSPEQATGAVIDHLTDIWSLGILLYEMLTGVRPFSGDYEQAVLYAIQHADPKPMRRHRAEIPEALDRAVRRALARTPSRRHQSADEFADVLRSIRRSLELNVNPIIPRDVGASIAPRIVAVGRDTEVKELLHHLDQAVSGSRRTVLVTGDAGTGKTTLANLFLYEALRTYAVAVGRGQCLEHRGPGEAYRPVLEALSRLCKGGDGDVLIDCLEQHAPTWLVQMPGLVNADREAVLRARVRGVTRERMLREIVEALDEFVATRPLILVLEDLHWCDVSTIDFVAWTARRTDPSRLMILATYRSGQVSESGDPVRTVVRELLSRGSAFEISLSLLDEGAVADLLAERFPDVKVPPSFVSMIHGRTEGHPLYLTSLIDHWISTAAIKTVDGVLSVEVDAGRLTCEVPDSLRHLIEQRFTGLDPADQALVESASVAGSIFSAAAASAGAGIPDEEAEMKLSALVNKGGLLRSDGVDEWPDGTISERYAFAHQLYRESLYERIPAGKKIRIHRAIGQRLAAAFNSDARRHAARLAMHFVEGRDWRRAVEFLRMAAEQAFHRSAHQDAIEHLDLALTTLMKLPDDEERRRLEIMIRSALGSALIMTEGWSSPKAEAAYVRARELSEEAEDHPHIIPVLYGLATLKEFQGEYATTKGILEQIFEVSGENEGLVVESHELMACSNFHQGEFEESLKFAETGLALSAGSKRIPIGMLGEDPEIACLGWAGMSLWFLGYPDQALANVVRGIEGARTAERSYGLADAHMRAALVATWRREADRTILYADRTIDLSRKQGFRYRLGVGKVLRGWARMLAGSAPDGIEEIREGIELHASTGAHMDRPFLLGLLAEAFSFGHAWDEGLQHVDDAISLVEEGRPFFYEAELHRIRGHLLRGPNGSPDEAEAEFQKAMSLAQRRNAASLQLRAALSLGELWSCSGDVRRARELIQPIVDAFTEGFETPDVLEARAALARLN